MSDSYVKCEKCGKTLTVSFSNCLRLGWPKCHGYTMTLIKTNANIDAAVSGIVKTAFNSSSSITNGEKAHE